MTFIDRQLGNNLIQIMENELNQIKTFNFVKHMERYATDLTLSFGFCFYFPLWLFFNFLISCLALPCPPVCKLEAVGRRIAIRAKVVQEGR